MRDEYYIRTKSSLTGKRVKKDPAFKLTMVYAGLLAQASKIASEIYRQLPKEQKGRSVYQKLAGEVLRLLKNGMAAEEIMQALKESSKTDAKPAEATPATVFHPLKTIRWMDDLLTNMFLAEEVTEGDEAYREAAMPP